MVVHVDEVLAGGLLLSGITAVRYRSRPCWPRRLVPDADVGQPDTGVGWGGDGELVGGRVRGGCRTGAVVSFAGNEFANSGGDVSGELFHSARVLRPEKVAAHALGEGEFGELLGPGGHRTAREATVDDV